LLIIWLSLFIEILILTLIKPFVVNYELVSIIAVSVHVLFSIFVLLGHRSKLRMIFLAGFIIRVLAMIWDIYARNIFIFPNSGADTEAFYYAAISKSETVSLLMSDSYGGLYPKIIGSIFYLIGPQRLVAQYINVLLGLSVIIILYEILILLEIKPKICKRIIIIAAFFPNAIIMSAIFLRESFIAFFISASLYFYIKWFKFGNRNNILLSITVLGIACVFHSGVFGLFLGYAVALLYYNRKQNIYKISLKTFFVFLLLVISMGFLFMNFGDVFFNKFKNISQLGDIYAAASKATGSSAYLLNLKIETPIQLIIYGPIRALYFLISPLPMDWRGSADIFAFLSDSLLYLGVIFYYFKNRKSVGKRRILVTSLILMIVGTSLIFGIGVSNAGTAIRHRQKIFLIFLVLFALMADGKLKKSTKSSN